MEEEKKNRPEEAADTAGETTADASQAETAETAAQETEADTREDAAEADASGGAEQTSGGTDDGSADTDKTDAKEPEKKKGFFGKKKDKKDEQIEELIDKNRRLMAEFDNYRKRTEKEKSAMFEVGARSMIEKVLPVVDNFERGLASIPEEQKDTPVAQGMEKIYKQMAAALEEMGVKPIEAVGKPFDPNLHNAVMHTEDDSLGENIVAQEFQKGYTYRDTVVRHSMVQVAN